MSILVARPVADSLVKSGLGELIVYRPHLSTSAEFQSALADFSPDVLLIGESKPDELALATWRRSSGNRKLIIIGTDESGQLPYASDYDIAFWIAPNHLPQHDLDALAIAEAHVMQCRLDPQLIATGLSSYKLRSRRSQETVLLAGAGIVNLISAWELSQAGYKLEVIDAGPDPRRRPDWRLLGATHGGGNARMFTLTEADNYNEKGSDIYSGMDTVLRHRITEGGWLTLNPSEYSDSEKLWLDRFHSIAPWMAEVFARNIYAFNRESLDLWRKMRAELPWLFQNVGYVGGVLRIYSETEAFQAAAALHNRLGSLRKILSSEETASRHPAFADACKSGEIVGGLEVVGFTLNIHDFSTRLIDALESRGVHFSWGVAARRIVIGPDDLVQGIKTDAGVARADHYVVSPGAYCKDWLAGTRTDGKVQGIFGLWLTLPNVDPPLRFSVKLHREGHVGEDSNITLASDDQSRPILLLGSGYGFCGTGPINLECPDVECLFKSLEETARRFLPANFACAVADGTINTSRKGCIRPFTATGLGVFEVLGTQDGGRMVITTGHNTGGFTQSPSVAKAVLATLNGLLHPMQELYNPERGFVSSNAAAIPLRAAARTMPTTGGAI
jgi:D-amino-acid dehydrogenase